MDKQQWKRISRIFDLALTMPNDRRTTYIKNLCGGDHELQISVNDLLTSVEESDKLLDDHLQKNNALLNELSTHLEKDLPAHSLIGSPMGRWRVNKLLGRGGMGEVYEAERIDSDIHQKGALKIVRRGFDTAENIQRFRLEKQILAGLHHPNIASLIDGGISDAGLPFLVMEYVDGIPIDQYCDQHQLTLNKRLSLFKTVCQAVQHAHKNLIVHRDLKPENILVSEEGYVKILDFGIAKLLDADLYELPAVETHKCMRLMSLEYAAPEQISGEAITTSADVYSLGVLFYKLLAGVQPFDFEDKRFSAIEQIVLHEDPPSPTHKLRRLPENKLAAIANKRQSSSNKLITQLTGDLNAIILKTLRKEPEKRYESVSQLDDDVDLYRQDKPVGARMDTRQYRISKFFKRHTKGMAAAAAFTAIIIALTTFYTFRLTEQRNVARMEANKTEQVKNLFIEIFQSGNPFQESDAKNLTVQQVLDQGTKRISKELESQPLIKAELQEALGSVYSGLMTYPKAESLLLEALSTYETELGPHHPDVARVSNLLGFILFRKGRFDDARNLFEDAQRIYKNKYGDDDPHYAHTINLLANLYAETAETERGIQLLDQAVRIYEKNNSPEIAAAISDLGYLQMGVGRLDEAIDNFHRSLDLYEEGDEKSDALLAITLTALAQTLHLKGDLKAAEAYYRQVMQIRQQIFETGPTYIAGTQMRLGWVLIDQGRVSEAIPMVEKALKSFKTNLPADHWKIAACESILALGWIGQGKFIEAEKILLNTHQLYIKQFGLNDFRTKSCIRALVRLYEVWGKPQKAQAFLED